MISVGVNYLYWVGHTNFDAYKNLELTAKTGADVVEYSALEMSKLSKRERIDFKKAAQDLGMKVAATGGMGPDFDLSSPDKAQREESIRLARRAIEVCHDVGSRDWCGVIYSKWFNQPTEPLTMDFRRAMWERGVESLKEVVKTAEDLDVILSLEILNRFEVYLLTTVELGIEYCEDIGSPYARLLMDVFHMNIEQGDIPATIRNAVSLGRMGHLHVSENNRQIPGLVKTRMPWDDIFAAVKESGYDGTVSIESFVKMDAPNAVALATWRDLLDDTSEEGMVRAMKQGVSFVKNALK